MRSRRSCWWRTSRSRPGLLAQLLEIPVREVEGRCASLSARYEASGHGFELVRVAGGYRFQTHPDLSAYVERYLTDGGTGRLSPAALETLAIVAYKQPVSRAQITSVRGVSVDGVVRTLTQRGLVAEVGRDAGPGQAVLYGTTALFLERLGLDSLADLPPLGEFVPGAEVVEALEDGLRAGATTPADRAGGASGRLARRRRARGRGLSPRWRPAPGRTGRLRPGSGCRRSSPGSASAAGGWSRTSSRRGGCR